jgi:hypothetical protein
MCESTDFKISEAIDTLTDGMLNLAEIKYLNTEIQKEIEAKKEVTTKKKERVEEKNLNYQNYLYQKEHIVTQINSCIHYPTTQMDRIELPNDNEVREKFMKDDITKIDLLNYELITRKELNETVRKINEEKEDNLVRLKEKERFSKELPSFLTSLENSTLKAQKYLNLNITEYNAYLTLAAKLPPPLYVIYNSLMLLNNSNIVCKLKILGKNEQVEEFYNRYQIDTINFDNLDLPEENSKEEGEHSDEEIEIQRNKRRTKNNANATKVTKFPLFIQFTVSKADMLESDSLPLVINFYFIPLFNAVTVEVQNKALKSAQLLSNIFRNISIVPELEIENAISI